MSYLKVRDQSKLVSQTLPNLVVEAFSMQTWNFDLRKYV